MSDSLRDTFNAFLCEGVVFGHCVVVEDNVIVYAGPINGAPKLHSGLQIYLSPVDFDKLKVNVNSKRH